MKSLELNWIRKKVDKTIPIPEVMFLSLGGNEMGGCYYDPNDNEELYDIDGKPHSMKYGVIVVNSFYNNETQMFAIAHEWRHHWQFFNGMKYDIPIYDELMEDYDEAVRQYFTTSKAELDALRFSYKYAKLGCYQFWEGILYDLIKDLLPKKIITYG